MIDKLIDDLIHQAIIHCEMDNTRALNKARKALEEYVSKLNKRIDNMRTALKDISQTGEGDNPYAHPVDRTSQCVDTAYDALKDDDKVK